MRRLIKEADTCEGRRKDELCSCSCADPDEKHDDKLDVHHVHVVGELDVGGRCGLLREGLLKPLHCGHPFHHALIWVVIHVVVLVDGVSENPEVVDTGKEVDNAQSVVLLFTDIGEEILSIDLYPVLFEHHIQVLHLAAAVCVEDTIFLKVLIDARHQALEEDTRQ